MEQIGDIYRSTNRLPFPGRSDIAIPAAMHYLKASDGLVLIDPFEMDPAHGRAVEDLGQPRYVLITNLNHERDAQLYRRRYGAVIGYHRDLAGYFDFEADFLFDDGDELPGGLRAVALPGTFRGETAFWHEGQGGSLVFGDALMNLDLSTYGFAGTFMGTVGWPDGLGTMPRVLMQDEERALESLRGLFDWDFSRLLMTHGTPVQIQARQALRLALNNYQPLVPYFMRRTASTLISRVWERVS
jgi:hypothetical protein